MATVSAGSVARDLSATSTEAVRDHCSFLTELSQHEADRGEAQERQGLSVEALPILAKRRQRLSHAMVRSTIRRLGKTAKPFAISERWETPEFPRLFGRVSGHGC